MEKPRDLIELQIGVALTKGITASYVRRMIECGVSLEQFFTLDNSAFARALGSELRFTLPLSHRQEALFKARQELKFIDAHGISVIFIGDSDYPVRLAQCPDAPVLLYLLGNPHSESKHILSVIGTRSMTAYGNAFCNKLIEEAAPMFPDLVIVSGLAYGADACAHSAAIAAGLPTIGILAHGLNMIYPAQHRDLARRILDADGALITEYPYGVKPFKGNFLQRNRIVAGIADATVVIESDIKGGAMSTANTAFSYSRDVLALPGRVCDRMSSGCNQLIRVHKAQMITSCADMIEALNWKPHSSHPECRQQNLFPELDDEQREIFNLLNSDRRDYQLDEITSRLNIPIATILSSLTEMEFDGIVMKLPGNRFTLAL